MKTGYKRDRSDVPKNSFQSKIKIFRILILVVIFLLLCAVGIVMMCKMEDIVEGRGTVAGRREYYMKSRVRSTIREIKFRSGDFVKKGQVMLTLDDRDYQEHCLKLRSSIVELEAEIRSADAALAALRIDPLPKEYRHSKITLDEFKKREVREKESLMAFRNLQKSGAVPLVEINKREIDFIHNQSELKRAERDVKLIENGLAQKIISKKEAELNLLKVRLENLKKEYDFYLKHKVDYTFVAPEDGYVSMIPTKIGIFVDVGEDIITFAAQGDKKFLALIHEKDIYKIQEKQKIRMKSSQYNYFEHGYFYGSIYAIDEIPRQIGDVSYYTVRIMLEDKPAKPLRLGSTGGVEILTGRDFIFKILFDAMN
ncbi:MAG: HlyD family efflux transporter periplasmic adaptor subunit [Lentisphaeria bacterium]|nr:HlyD family efflux transporter periplasmic adaptor subunit [Lentisphaeria bacterium]